MNFQNQQDINRELLLEAYSDNLVTADIIQEVEEYYNILLVEFFVTNTGFGVINARVIDSIPEDFDETCEALISREDFLDTLALIGAL